ncbi:MAG: hydantoinase/oxoprolinase family protein [Alphaproteobacteria bacterium]|nr:hydantoinase/oxoprolinase family protein [Alphaproteobacteria bacterium]
MADSASGDPAKGGGLWLGLDTGGTYTDAVILAAGRTVVATAKELTTRHDLSLGLGRAMRSAVALLPAGLSTRDIALVSISTTLATNAVVENQRSPICAILIGYDQAMLSRAGLHEALAGNPIVLIKGGHHATGEEAATLDLDAAKAAILEHAARVEAFSVSSLFSVRNPNHELRIRQLVRELTKKPVTCGHELTSRLDAPRRALTAALNAQLTPQLERLIEAVLAVLASLGIGAPLMVVKGDGSLMDAAVARECPVETILSGPAASVVGAAFLTGLAHFVVADMGGTTTDIAIVRDGRPVLKADGARVGGWNTMVQAVDVQTSGLGGDSAIAFDRRGRMTIGPQRVVPLSLLAASFPVVLEPLRRQAEIEPLAPNAGRFAVRRPAGPDEPALSPAERRIWDALASGPRPLAEIVRGLTGAVALDALLRRGLISRSGLTPSDAMHVLGEQDQWDIEAARLGARIWAREARNLRGETSALDAAAFCSGVREQVVRAAGRLLYESLFAHDPGIVPVAGSWGGLGDALLDALLCARAPSGLVRVAMALDLPLVAIGGPVRGYYPEVARRLSAELIIPEHAAVSNAIGAVCGVVARTVEIVVTQSKIGLFRVHTPDGIKDFRAAEAALEHARLRSRELALEAALRSGAAQPKLETEVSKKLAERAGGDHLLVEAVVRSTAIGRPLAAHTAADGGGTVTAKGARRTGG